MISKQTEIEEQIIKKNSNIYIRVMFIYGIDS